MTTTALRTRQQARSQSRTMPGDSSDLRSAVRWAIARFGHRLTEVAQALVNRDFVLDHSSPRILAEDLDRIFEPIQERANREFEQAAGYLPPDGVGADDIARIVTALSALARSLDLEVDVVMPTRTAEPWAVSPEATNAETKQDIFYPLEPSYRGGPERIGIDSDAIVSEDATSISIRRKSKATR